MWRWMNPGRDFRSRNPWGQKFSARNSEYRSKSVDRCGPYVLLPDFDTLIPPEVGFQEQGDLLLGQAMLAAQFAQAAGDELQQGHHTSMKEREFMTTVRSDRYNTGKSDASRRHSMDERKYFLGKSDKMHVVAASGFAAGQCSYKTDLSRQFP
jgi:hypothetical protein